MDWNLHSPSDQAFAKMFDATPWQLGEGWFRGAEVASGAGSGRRAGTATVHLPYKARQWSGKERDHEL